MMGRRLRRKMPVGTSATPIRPQAVSPPPPVSAEFVSTFVRNAIASEANLVMQALGVSQEVQNNFPLGCSLLLQRASQSPRELEKEIPNITLRHITEYWLVARELATRLAFAKVKEFIASILSLKSEVEIVDAYLNLIINNEKDILPLSSDLNSPKPAADDILKILASSLAPSFGIKAIPDRMKRLFNHSLSRFTQFIAWAIPTNYGTSKTPVLSMANVPDLTLSTFKAIMAIFANLPTDTTVLAMGQRFSCHAGLISISWSYFRHFISACGTSSTTSNSTSVLSTSPSGSSESPTATSSNEVQTHNMQNDVSSTPLDFGSRLMPDALKHLLEFFKSGVTAHFTDYLSAQSILLHAEELRLVDDSGRALPGFSDLIAHLKTIYPYEGNIPDRYCFYSLAFALETQDRHVWDQSLRILDVDLDHKHHRSDAALWFHRTHPEAYWLATWELITGEKEYPFKVEEEEIDGLGRT